MCVCVCVCVLCVVVCACGACVCMVWNSYLTWGTFSQKLLQVAPRKEKGMKGKKKKQWGSTKDSTNKSSKFVCGEMM